MLTTDFQEFGILEEYQAIDEMTVKYYGHNSLREFICGKPEMLV
jgi:hypothetical protein